VDHDTVEHTAGRQHHDTAQTLNQAPDLALVLAQITALAAQIRVSGGAAPRTHTRACLDTAAGYLTQAGQEIAEALADLHRVAAVPPDACRIEWGVCPQHGDTLTASGGRTWCRARGCARTWEYNHLGTPCAEPTTYTVTDAAGSPPLRVCHGHALAARHIVGVSYDPPLPAGAIQSANLHDALLALTGAGPR
jgi:hypothetical protein